MNGHYINFHTLSLTSYQKFLFSIWAIWLKISLCTLEISTSSLNCTCYHSFITNVYWSSYNYLRSSQWNKNSSDLCHWIWTWNINFKFKISTNIQTATKTKFPQYWSGTRFNLRGIIFFFTLVSIYPCKPFEVSIIFVSPKNIIEEKFNISKPNLHF